MRHHRATTARCAVDCADIVMLACAGADAGGNQPNAQPDARARRWRPNRYGLEPVRRQVRRR